MVSLRQELQWQERGALYGKKVLLTGTPDYVQKAALPLRKHGAEAAEVSLIYPQEPQEGTFSAIPWGDYTWLVLTSANGVELFFAGLQRDGVDLRQLLHLHFAVIGKGTAQALARHGIFADCIPPQFHSDSLAEALIPQLAAQDKVLLLRAENGSEVLSQRLEQAGVCFHTVPFYAVKSDWRKKQLLLAELKTADYVFLASSSAARTFAEMTAGEDPYAAQVISIGDATTHTAESLESLWQRRQNSQTLTACFSVFYLLLQRRMPDDRLSHLPAFAGKKCVVFGAGKTAQRRVQGLLQAGAMVTVIARNQAGLLEQGRSDLCAGALPTGVSGGGAAGVCSDQ